MTRADWDKKEKASAALIAKQKEDLKRLGAELKEQKKEKEKLKSQAREKAKATSKKSARAGTQESDSSDTSSNQNVYGASNKNPVVTPSHVSSSKYSRKEGSPAKKAKVDTLHPGLAGPSQRHLTKTEMNAKKGPPIVTPKKPQGQGNQPLNKQKPKSSFGQELAKLDTPKTLYDQKRNLGNKNSNLNTHGNNC